MSFISKDVKIKKIYHWKENRLQNIHFPHGLYKEIMREDGSFFDIPINALRVLFNIISLVKNDQFLYNKYPEKLSLYEKKFEKDKNVFVQICIKNDKISPSKSGNQVKKAYEFLTKFKFGWHKDVNSKGEKIETYEGLISRPTYNHRGQTTFLISNYWLRKILVMPHYNPVPYDLVYNISNKKHILFALWLETIKIVGTELRLDTFNKKFGVNYSNSSDFCTKFLFEIKKNFNENNDKSFTYNYNGKYITIKPVDNQRQSYLENKTVLTKIKYKLNYFKSRFNIQKDNYLKFSNAFCRTPQDRDLIEEAYKQFKLDYKRKRLTYNLYTDKNFLEEMQKIVIDKYWESETGKRPPNGFPRII